MSHLYKLTEFENASGWKCGDLEDLGHGSNYWWLPARMLNLTPATYLKWVIDNFHPDEVYHSNDYSLVGWSWKKQSDMRVYKNKMNALARQKNFLVC